MKSGQVPNSRSRRADAYVCRLLPLTCLAPDIVEAILYGRQPKGLRLAKVLGSVAPTWNQQLANWAFPRLVVLPAPLVEGVVPSVSCR